MRTNNPPYVCIISLLVNIMFFQYISAQTEGKKEKAKYYKTWVALRDNPLEIEGYMTDVMDSLIMLRDISSPVQHQYFLGDIDYLKFQKERVLGKNVLIGALGGAALGGATFALGAKSPCREAFCFKPGFASGALGGFALGALVGAISSGKTVKIRIRGSRRELQEKLLQYKSTF